MEIEICFLSNEMEFDGILIVVLQVPKEKKKDQKWPKPEDNPSTVVSSLTQFSSVSCAEGHSGQDKM